MDIGSFRAKETVMMCPHGHASLVSEQLPNLAPEKGTFGFDVIVEVGYSLFVHSCSNEEVMAKLAAKNVFISEREVSYLGRKLIIYLAIAHPAESVTVTKFHDQKWWLHSPSGWDL